MTAASDAQGGEQDENEGDHGQQAMGEHHRVREVPFGRGGLALSPHGAAGTASVPEPARPAAG
ncbi:hypothetical protein QNO09_25710 [Streptomyces sp. 378]|uniref:hypothetical protein n=1 Tax=Streptomyces sp. 378 TaxID=3049412 RepID=UPI0024C4710C|nr:hypothetical protein [Streptomyces sp. 378]MDK1346643.1 hypothetical protein [Streptomyces sp. 378]